MDNFAKACSASEIPDGEMRIFVQAGVRFLIGNKDGKFFAMLNQCPHADGSLGDGMINDEGSVICPLHSWKFDHKTGQCPEQNSSTPIFDVEERDGDVYINEAQLEEHAG